MTEKEKEAIESLKGKEISVEVNWTPKQKSTFEKILGISEFEENCIKVSVLIDLINKLQKENKVLKEENKKLDKIADKMYDYLSYYAWDDFHSNTGYNGEMFDYFYKEIDDE